jgi:hypothetical protein
MQSKGRQSLVGQRGGHVIMPATPVIHRAAFRFDGPMSLSLEVFEPGPSTDGPYGEPANRLLAPARLG